jgi:hypothetical protein
MNALHTSLRAVLIGFAITGALAIDAARAEPSADVMRIDCRHRYISLADAAQLFGTHNVWRAFAMRRTLYADLARACAGREGTVTVHRGARFAHPHGR